MTNLDLMEAKYEKMGQESSPRKRQLLHDALNCATMVIASEYGMVKMLKMFSRSAN